MRNVSVKGWRFFYIIDNINNEENFSICFSRIFWLVTSIVAK
jgi:hypothetical protein